MKRTTRSVWLELRHNSNRLGMKLGRSFRLCEQLPIKEIGDERVAGIRVVACSAWKSDSLPGR